MRSYPARPGPDDTNTRLELGRARARARRRRRRRTYLVVLLLLVVTLVGADLVRRGLTAGAGPRTTVAHTVAPPPTSQPPTSAPASTPPTTSPPGPILALNGPVPLTGSGTWNHAQTQGAVLGTAGTLRRFHVAIETDLAQDVAEFTAILTTTLGDPRSWIGGRQVRLQQVPPAVGADFAIFLATPDTTRKMCAAAGVNTVFNGESFTSCRTFGRVILNYARWMRSVPDYVTASIPLEVYRQYVINHEVGHEVGYGHELCPGIGRVAPVMQTQTLGLRGCTANPWPYLNGRRYAGRPA